MAEITAGSVNELRKRTGLGLMECKTLLKETDGDMKRAETLAREKGMVKASGRSGRSTNAGRVDVAFAPDHTAGAIVELLCETDFVARNDAFRQAAKDLAEQVLAAGETGIEDQKFAKDPSKTVREFLLDLNARTGENVSLARAAKFDAPNGQVDAYVHHDAKSGAMVQIDGATSPEARALARDLALHVVAKRPVSVNRSEVPEALVAEQRSIFEVQAADKPENIRGKIVEGKVEAWFGDNTLVDQTFVKDEAKRVREIVAAVGKDLTVSRMARFVVGETPEG